MYINDLFLLLSSGLSCGTTPLQFHFTSFRLDCPPVLVVPDEEKPEEEKPLMHITMESLKDLRRRRKVLHAEAATYGQRNQDRDGVS